MFKPKIIQGGMGVAISSYKLASAVSQQGHLGVVSGTAVGLVLLARLIRGDPSGDARRAMAQFPDQNAVKGVLERFYIEDGLPEGKKPPYPDMWTIDPSRERLHLNTIGAFVEVWLAKEGHQGAVAINVLEKIQLPNLSTFYGAMLAGVDYVLVGAGIPLHVPGVLDKMVNHQITTARIDVRGSEKEDVFENVFDPKVVFDDVENWPELKRPWFFPIISTAVLGKALLKRANGRVDGFIVEHHSAGGHNAPPRGNAPAYGDKDEVSLAAIAKLGLPFWLAGGYGTPEGFKKAREAGAAGVQVGTLFAYSDESGMDPTVRQKVLNELKTGTVNVRTDMRASPTGFPFKVVEVPGTMSDLVVLQSRKRICDLGLLRQPYKKEDGSVGYRCASEPKAAYVRKGGAIEATEGRLCLCNGLCSTAGFALPRRNGPEPVLVTSGDNVGAVKALLGDKECYHAIDVIEHILSAV